MTNKTNKYGVSRYVPEHVKREIRQRCGFGCVICGLGFYDYEHFEPDFSEAKAHNPAGMTLLCPNCNQKRARNRLSAEAVALANAKPKCLQQGFSKEQFDFSTTPVYIRIGGIEIHNCKYILVINDMPLISILPPLEEGQPVRVSGFFTDGDGNQTLTLLNNEWSADTGSWDVESIGPVITIRSGPRNISLKIRLNPPHSLSIEQLQMKFEGYYIKCDTEHLEFSQDGENWSRFGAGIWSNTSGIAFNFRNSNERSANDRVYDF